MSATPRHVFICGNARAGTTLLVRLLDGHPSCMVLPWDTRVQDVLMDRALSRVVIRAAHILDRYELTARLGGRRTGPLVFKGRANLEARLTRWLADFTGPVPSDAVVAARAAAARADLPKGYWTAFFTMLAHVEGGATLDRPVWVEKTPLNETLVPLFDRLFGTETRYLHIVRDPRAVVSSWLATRRLTGSARAGAILDRCVDWARSVDRCRYHLRVRAGRYHAVRYEDLVSAPGKVMTGVCHFLSLEPHATATVATHLGVPAVRNTSFPGTHSPGEVSHGGAGGVTEALDHRERAQIEGWLGAQMAACGYRTVAEGGGTPAGRGHERGGRSVRAAMKRAELARRQKAVGGARIAWPDPVMTPALRS